jgi:hypothetical protein
MATGTTAADVVESFMALLLLHGFSTPSLLAQGEQRPPSYFNIDRDIPRTLACKGLARRSVMLRAL